VNNLPATPADFLAQLLAGGTLYGLFSTWLIDGLISLWQAHAGAPISGTKRRWLSIAVALVVPVVAYGGLIALGAATASADGVYSAALVGVAAVSGGKLAYAARESLNKPAVPVAPPVAPQTARLPPLAPDRTAAPSAPGAPSLPPARGAPAPAAADPPSLADELRADYQRRGDLPPDVTPEDTV
jgi:hypothetical protein